MKLLHLTLSLASLAVLPTFILATAVPHADGAQVGVSHNDLGVAALLSTNAGEKCKVYTDCARCQPGYWRCCFSGCAGHEMPGSHTCSCVQDGHDLGASCGCT